MAVKANISPVSDSANAEELRSVVYPLTHDPGERVVCVGERVFRHPRLASRASQYNGDGGRIPLSH